MDPVVVVALVVVVLVALGAGVAVRSRGAPKAPWLVAGKGGGALVLFGHLATEALARVIVEESDLDVVCAPDLAPLRTWLAGNEAVGLVAMSRQEHPGEAALAINALRSTQQGRAAIYHAWDTNVERGARRAVEAGADALLVPETEVADLLAVVVGAVERARAGVLPPTTPGELVEALRAAAPSSPFWDLQEAPERAGY